MSYSKEEIRKAAQALSERYRQGTPPFLRSPIDRQAYLLTRFPATEAALKRVFQEIRHFPIQSMLDIGAGPGTSWGAASDTWSSLKRATLVERDADFVEIGKTVVPTGSVTWVCQEAAALKAVERHDLVLFSYSWGEIGDLAVLHEAWQLVRQFLVVVEPGTPLGFDRMLRARDFCIGQGGIVYAPCPHSRACPWEKSSEWCHFGVRLERSFEHRHAKEAALGYEDEKFSYVILSKQERPPAGSRLLRDPVRRKGHTLLTLCAEEGIEKITVTKSRKEQYKRVNKMKWGDFFS